MNSKERRVFRRAIDRFMDVYLRDAYGGSDIPSPPLAPRLRKSRTFWLTLEACENAARGDDPYADEHDDDYSDADYWDEEDEDGDTLGCWESGEFRPGLCPDDLCHGANRCMVKARPWEGG